MFCTPDYLLTPYQACIVLIQTLEHLHEDASDDLNQPWLECVAQESTVYLLMSVLVQLASTCKEETGERCLHGCVCCLNADAFDVIQADE